MKILVRLYDVIVTEQNRDRFNLIFLEMVPGEESQSSFKSTQEKRTAYSKVWNNKPVLLLKPELSGTFWPGWTRRATLRINHCSKSTAEHQRGEEEEESIFYCFFPLFQYNLNFLEDFSTLPSGLEMTGKKKRHVFHSQLPGTQTWQFSQ